MRNITKTVSLLVIFAAGYIAGTASHNSQTTSNPITNKKTTQINDKYQEGFNQGYQNGCLDTQEFWHDVDPDTYMNFFMKKTGENQYVERETRKQTPLEKFLNNKK